MACYRKQILRTFYRCPVCWHKLGEYDEVWNERKIYEDNKIFVKCPNCKVKLQIAKGAGCELTITREPSNNILLKQFYIPSED